MLICYLSVSTLLPDSIPGTLQLLSDLVTVHMPFVYPWVWILILWFFCSLVLRWWRNQGGPSEFSPAGRKREPLEFLKIFSKVLVGLSLFFCAGVGLLLLNRALGSAVLAALALGWWVYFGLGFVRPRSRAQTLTDRTAAGVMVMVAGLFSLYINSTGPSYYLARLSPEGGQGRAYVRSLASEKALSPGQVRLWLGSDLENLRGNALAYLLEVGTEPGPELREKVSYLAEYDRSKSVQQLATQVLKLKS